MYIRMWSSGPTLDSGRSRYPETVKDNVLLSGKLPAALLRELLDAADPLPAEVRLGPAVGEDACAIDVPGGVLVAATDPITLTGHEVGAHAVVINANDVAVMGVRPRWFLATLLLPAGTRSSEVRELFARMRETLAGLGATLVGGHTEVTAAVTQPVVVGQMLGLREDRHFVRSSGVHPGDVIVQIGPAPVEAAKILVGECVDRLQHLDAAVLERARGALQDPGISVVEPALAAAELGATALHDPTEGGLSTGLYELAEASELKLTVDVAAVLWFRAGAAVCEALGADPWGALASGTLLAAFSAVDARRAREQLEARGWPTSVIASAEPGQGVFAAERPLVSFDRDEVARLLG